MKKLTKKQKYLKGLIVWWLVFIGIILLLLWIFSNKSLYAPSREHIKESVNEVINQIAANTPPIQKSFVDKGCTESDIRWLSSSYQCTFEADIYFMGSGSASVDFDRMRQALEHKRFRLVNSDVSLEKSTTVRYESHKNITIYFKIFRPSSPETEREYLQIDTDIPVVSDKYIYGIHVQAPYWSCSSGALWEGRCPAPPSPTTPAGYHHSVLNEIKEE